MSHTLPLTQNTSWWSDDSDFDTSPKCMCTNSTTRAPASRSPSPALHLPLNATSHTVEESFSDATSSNSMSLERRAGIHDDSACKSSTPHQLHGSISNPSHSSSRSILPFLHPLAHINFTETSPDHPYVQILSPLFHLTVIGKGTFPVVHN